MTWLLDWARSLFTPLPEPTKPPPMPSRFGRAALAIARMELGKGETTGNNAGPDLDRYRNGGPGGPWCAAFVSYCIIAGANELRLPPPVKRTHGAKRLFEACCTYARVERPQPGDMVAWHRGAAGARTGHIGIVSRPPEGSLFHSIEGNKGLFPSMVREFAHEIGEASLLGFARLP